MTPRPRVMNPVIASPGNGLQHRAKRTSMSPTPETITALPIARRCSLTLRGSFSPGAEESVAAESFLTPIKLQFVGRQHFAQHLRDGEDPVTHRRDQTIDIAMRKFLQRRLEATLHAQMRHAQTEWFEFAIDQRHAQFKRTLRLLRAQPLADAALGARRDDVIRPILARRLPLGRVHLDRVARVQSIAQRHHAAVDTRAGQMLADLRMDAIGEVDHGRAERKIQQVALRRENEDLFGEEVILDGREKFLRVLQILLPLD